MQETKLKKIKKVALKFLRGWQKKQEYLGAVLTGSFITGFNDKYSDIDLHIILKQNTKYKERGNKKMDGFLLEYFANPLEEFQQYFSDDYRNKQRKSAARQLLTGVILDDKTKKIEKLIAQARQWMRKKFKNLKESDLELIKYGVQDDILNLRSLFSLKNAGFEFNYYLFLNYIYKNYMMYLQSEILPAAKLYTYLTNADYRKKYLYQDLEDKEFKKLFIKALEARSKNNKIQKAETLAAYVIHKLDGMTIDNWKLRTEITK